MKFLVSLLFRANRLIIWLQHKLSPKQFVIFSAILIGLTAGLAAVLLKLFVHFLLKNIEFLSQNKQVYIAMFPLIGITLCVLFVHYINGNKLGKGIANILHAIAKIQFSAKRSNLQSYYIKRFNRRFRWLFRP